MSILIRNINKKILGRVALNFVDIVGLKHGIGLACKSFPDEEEYAFVEIGTLYGGGTIAISNIMKKWDRENQTVITIDPFTGYYGGKRDPLSRISPTLDIVKENFKRFNINPKIIIGKSGDVLSQLSDYKIFGVFIDGDHTYEGVKSDWDNYSPLVMVSGVVLFHDYNSHLNVHGDYGVLKFVTELIPTIVPEWRVHKARGNTICLERLK